LTSRSAPPPTCTLLRFYVARVMQLGIKRRPIEQCSATPSRSLRPSSPLTLL